MSLIVIENFTPSRLQQIPGLAHFHIQLFDCGVRVEAVRENGALQAGSTARVPTWPTNRKTSASGVIHSTACMHRWDSCTPKYKMFIKYPTQTLHPSSLMLRFHWLKIAAVFLIHLIGNSRGEWPCPQGLGWNSAQCWRASEATDFPDYKSQNVITTRAIKKSGPDNMHTCEGVLINHQKTNHAGCCTSFLIGMRDWWKSSSADQKNKCNVFY
ncbi:hypothetical protein Pst134EB_030147 [Puccinia striiformis f. sp. tritici]|nr:hypothetical protein Pst134EB_030147 [Puccinia striiformis f. sp. tritici]